MTLKKLRKILSKDGYSDEAIESLIKSKGEQVDEEAEISEDVEEDEVAPVDEPSAEPEGESEPSAEPEGAESQVPPTEPESTPEPEVPSEPEPQAEPEPSVPPVEGEVPPVEPLEPEVNPEPQVDYKQKYDEAMSAIDGLNAKFDSLLESLKASGILTVAPEAPAPVGIDQSVAPANDAETSMEDTLSKLNRGRQY